VKIWRTLYIFKVVQLQKLIPQIFQNQSLTKHNIFTKINAEK